MFSINDLCRRYGGLSRQTIQRWAIEGILPEPLRVGTHARWTDSMVAEAERDATGILAELARPLIHLEKEKELEAARVDLAAKKTDTEKQIEKLEEEIERLKYWRQNLVDSLHLPPQEQSNLAIFVEVDNLRFLRHELCRKLGLAPDAGGHEILKAVELVKNPPAGPKAEGAGKTTSDDARAGETGGDSTAASDAL